MTNQVIIDEEVYNMIKDITVSKQELEDIIKIPKASYYRLVNENKLPEINTINDLIEFLQMSTYERIIKYNTLF